MDRATAQGIIAAEGLERAVWFQVPAGKPDAVAVSETSDGYRVVSTDERAVEIGPRDFQDESEALNRSDASRTVTVSQTTLARTAER